MIHRRGSEPFDKAKVVEDISAATKQLLRHRQAIDIIELGKGAIPRADGKPSLFVELREYLRRQIEDIYGFPVHLDHVDPIFPGRWRRNVGETTSAWRRRYCTRRSSSKISGTWARTTLRAPHSSRSRPNRGPRKSTHRKRASWTPRNARGSKRKSPSSSCSEVKLGRTGVQRLTAIDCRRRSPIRALLPRRGSGEAAGAVGGENRSGRDRPTPVLKTGGLSHDEQADRNLRTSLRHGARTRSVAPIDLSPLEGLRRLFCGRYWWLAGVWTFAMLLVFLSIAYGVHVFTVPAEVGAKLAIGPSWKTGGGDRDLLRRRPLWFELPAARRRARVARSSS